MFTNNLGSILLSWKQSTRSLKQNTFSFCWGETVGAGQWLKMKVNRRVELKQLAINCLMFAYELGNKTYGSLSEHTLVY